MSGIKLFTVLLLAFLLTGCVKRKENAFYKGNPEPLLQNAYIKLPLGAIKPEGWLKDQLRAQASGLTGNVDDFWPDLISSSWRGGKGEAWERGPYYLDGLVPLAYLLDDEQLKQKVRNWIEPILASSTDTGWYGPAKNKDRWPLAVANKVLVQYYEASSDKRALDVLTGYFRYIRNTPPDMWAHQYDQQSNQVVVNGEKRAWSTNGPYSNIYGLMPNFACCLANMHQGWPKYTASLWMATNDNGLVAVSYSPSTVSAKVGSGTEIKITGETDYPFRGDVRLRIKTANEDQVRKEVQ